MLRDNTAKLPSTALKFPSLGTGHISFGNSVSEYTECLQQCPSTLLICTMTQPPERHLFQEEIAHFLHIVGFSSLFPLPFFLFLDLSTGID